MGRERITGGEARIEVAAPPAAVWAVVSDVTRVREWSPENRGATWLKGATGPAVGARFRGTNRRGLARWSTVCTIVTLEPERAIAWEVRPPWGGTPSARWGYELRPTQTGTEVVERWEILTLGPVIKASMVLLSGSVPARLEVLRRSLDQSVAGLKELLERDAVGSGQA